MKASAYRAEFVDQLPDQLESGVLYVSIPCVCVAHLCACGCKSLVITPLSPTDWTMAYDGDNVSLSPSIGNWNFPCRSHYWINRGRVEWAKTWSTEQIAQNRQADVAAKKAQYGQAASVAPSAPALPTSPMPPAATKHNRKTLWSWLFGE